MKMFHCRNRKCEFLFIIKFLGIYMWWWLLYSINRILWSILCTSYLRERIVKKKKQKNKPLHIINAVKNIFCCCSCVYLSLLLHIYDTLLYVCCKKKVNGTTYMLAYTYMLRQWFYKRLNENVVHCNRL